MHELNDESLPLEGDAVIGYRNDTAVVFVFPKSAAAICIQDLAGDIWIAPSSGPSRRMVYVRFNPAKTLRETVQRGDRPVLRWGLFKASGSRLMSTTCLSSYS